MKPSLASPAGACTLALALLVAGPPAAHAVAPALLIFVKQIAKNMVMSGMKQTLLSSLSGSGCKGQAIAGALVTVDAVRGGGLGGLAAMAGGGMGMSPMPSMAGVASMPLGGPAPAQPGGGFVGFGGGFDPHSAGLAKIAPHAAQIRPEDIPDAARSAQIMAAMGKPLTPKETVAVIDDMAAIGMLPKAVQTELKECVTLIPQAAAGLGVAFAMLKPAVQQLRKARADMHALPPAEQDEIVAALRPELQAMSAEERASLREVLGSGFFPPRVVEGLRSLDR